MNAGDLVRVKDLLGYNTYMQNLAGHTGIVVNKINGTLFLILILDKLHRVNKNDLEVI
jgi:hypothetical protein